MTRSIVLLHIGHSFLFFKRNGKISFDFQNTDALPYWLTVGFLSAFGEVRRVLSTQLDADLTLGCGVGSNFHALLHIDEKSRFYLQTACRIMDTFLFLIYCKQTRYPFRQLSHRQIFMQNEPPHSFDIFNVSANSCNFIYQNDFVDFFTPLLVLDFLMLKINYLYKT